MNNIFKYKREWLVYHNSGGLNLWKLFKVIELLSREESGIISREKGNLDDESYAALIKTQLRRQEVLELWGKALK